MADLSAPPTPLPRDMLAEHLLRLFIEQSERNAERRAALRSVEDWQAERVRLLDAYRTMLGPFPVRCDLRPRVTGQLERERYTVEKLIFESQPGLLVTANAYVPQGVRGRVPGVLVPCGHSETGKAGDTYQQVCSGLASLGFFVLIYDPIGQGERKLYWDAKRGVSRLGGNTTQHSYAGNQYLLAGTNLANLMVWDSIRAVDYLCSRPEVDPERIAMVGNSGGGTNTTYTVPLEERIKVAVPCCYITTLAWRRRVWSTGDAEQNLVGQLPAGLDHADFLRLIAPRPVLVGSASLDYFPLEGARESVASARALYDRLGAGDHIEHVMVEAGHGYSPGLRQATYRWLARWLDVDVSPEQAAEVVETEADLQCTPDGQVALLGSENAHSLLRKTLHPAAMHQQDAAERAAKLMAYESPVARPAARPTKTRLLRYHGLQKVEAFELWPEPDLVVPGEALTWRPHIGPRRALLWLGPRIDDTGARHAGLEAVANALLPQGWMVAAADVRGAGETAPRDDGRANRRVMGAEAFLTYETFVLGKPLLGMRVRDAACALDYLLSRDDVEKSAGVAVVGWGAGGLVALHLAALDERITAVATVETLASYRSVAEHEHYAHSVSGFVPGAVATERNAGGYDLDDLVAGIAPRRVLQLRPVDQENRPLSAEADQEVTGALVAWLTEDRSRV